MPWPKLFMALGSLYGLLAVCLGAFGAHALKAVLSEKSQQTWQTAVHYQFYHLIPLIFVGYLLQKNVSTLLVSTGLLYAFGILLFSGSLYWLALGGPRWLGPITPLGGLCFIIAWFLFAVYILKN